MYITVIVIACVTLTRDVSCLSMENINLSAATGTNKSPISVESNHMDSKYSKSTQIESSCTETNSTLKYSFCTGILRIPMGYDRLSLPNSKSQSSVPLQIKMEFVVMDILEVNDKDFSVTVSMYLGLYWEDLQLTEHLVCKSAPCHVPIDNEVLSKIWHPDVYIYNLKSIQVLKVLSKFQGRLLNYLFSC